MDTGAHRRPVAGMAEVEDTRRSFSAGEISPALFAHDDLARWRLGLDRIENMVVMLEGGLTRAPGTKFVRAHKTEGETARFLRFRYTGSDNYIIAVNGGAARFLKDGGVLESPPGTPYEISVPYVAADLDKLRDQQDENHVYLACDGYEPRKLIRAGHTSWSLALYQPNNGPVDAQNLDTNKLITASGVQGAINLQSNFDAFVAGDVGAVWRLDEADLSIISQWKAGEVISLPVSSILGSMSGQIGNFVTMNLAFDGNLTTYAERVGVTEGYIGASFSSPQPVAIVTADTTQVTGNWIATGADLVAFELYGKQGAAPANATDGTKLATASVRNIAALGDPQFAIITLVSNDHLTTWSHIWIRMTTVNVTGLRVGEFTMQRYNVGSQPVQRRWQGRVYAAVKNGTTSANPPTHTEGVFLDQPSGVSFSYRHRDRGFVRITGYTSARQVSATVLERLPESVAQRGTYRWFPGEWCPARGWPTRIGMHDGRPFFGRKNKWWITRPADPDNLEVLPTSDTASPDTALAVRLRPQKVTVPHIEWMISAGAMIIGLRDGERIVRAGDIAEPLTLDKLGTAPGSSDGSAEHEPADVDDGVVFIGRSRDRLHFIKIDNEAVTAALNTDEITKTSRRIFSGKAKRPMWARDPNRVLWVMCQDGTLQGVTFMPKEQVVGFFRRPFTNAFIEDIGSLPTSDEGVSEVLLSTRRTINANTRRYIERMQEFFTPADVNAPTAAGAWFLDCAIRYQGAPTKTFSGAAHLAGQVCRVFADGAQRENVTPNGLGDFTLKANASDVIIGIPLRGYIRTLPIEIATKDGSTSRGRVRHAHHVVVSLVESAGGRVRVNGGDWAPILETGDTIPGQPIKLFSGDIRVPLNPPGDTYPNTMTVLEFECDHALPFTLAAFKVEMNVEG